MNTEEPDWQLLPDRPRDFFALEQGFDRSDLKRAYNRWLRRFKPERAPDEFRRIRAAYEQLDEMLRYGVSMQSRGMDVAADPQPEARDSEGSADTGFPTALRLATAEPKVVLEELEAHASKTPENWVERALLIDELDDSDSLALFGALIEAVIACEGHRTVVNFLTDACREPLSIESAAQLVTELTVLVARPDRPAGFPPIWYDVTTEPLWCQLIRDADHDTFTNLFESCRKRIGGEDGDSYLVLSFRLLRRGLFTAPASWIAERRRELELRYAELPVWLQDELDSFLWLLRYLDVRADFIGTHPIRIAVDQAACAILAGDDSDADRAFFRLHATVLDRADSVMEAFPVGDRWDAATAPIAWYADQVEDRYVRTVAVLSDRAKAESIADFFRTEELRVEHSAFRALRGMATLFRFWIWFVFGAAPILALFHLPKSDRWSAALTVVTALLSATLAWFHRSRIDGWLKAPNEWLSRRHYCKQLRAATVRFMLTTLITPDELFGAAISESKESYLVRAMLSDHLLEDPAVLLISIAHQFAE